MTQIKHQFNSVTHTRDLLLQAFYGGLQRPNIFRLLYRFPELLILPVQPIYAVHLVRRLSARAKEGSRPDKTG